MYAHFALQKLHILPGTLEALPQAERAFVYASCLYQQEQEAKALKQAHKKRR